MSIYQSLDSATQFKTILLKGMSGAGKTYKAAQFPKPAIINWDNNLSGLRKLPESVRRDIKIVNPRMTPNGKEVEPINIWDNFVKLLEQVLDDKEIRTVIIDSLTMMVEPLMDKVINSADPKTMVTLQNWGTFQRYLKWLGDELLNANDLDKHVIIIGHEKFDKDELTQSLTYSLNIGGKMATGFDVYFSDVWRCHVKGAERSAPTYWVRTVAGANFSAKCSFADLPIDFEWDKDKGKVLEQL